MVERFSEFDINKAAEALGAEPHETYDVAHGDGHEITVGETNLEVYTNARVARVTTSDARIELFRVPTYNTSDERLVFQQGDASRTRLLLRGDGRVWLYPALRAAESSRPEEVAASDEMVSPNPAESSTAATVLPDNVPATGPEHQEPEQLQLSGRLGRDPWFGTRGEEPAAGFPLAVNEEGGKTTWHRVVVVGELVEQLRIGLEKGQLKKGRLIQLTGTEVVQSEQTAKGGTRTTTEFHATAFTPLTAKRARPSR
jgi:Single-strand binding protein family